METLWQDLHFGFRMLMKRPGFTLVAIITLALGIGATTVIFSVVNAVLLRSLPYKDPDRLVMVSTYGKQDNAAPTISGPDFSDCQQRSHSVDDFAGMLAITATLTGEGPPETVDEAIVTWNLFPLLGVEMAHGRNFLPEEDVANGPKVVIISDGLWQRRFGAQPDLVGKTIPLSGEAWTVVGILPATFKLYLPPDAHRLKDKNPDVWVPMRRDFTREQRNNNYMTSLGRLKPGVTLQQAQAEMDILASQLREEQAEHQVDERRIRLAVLQQKIVHTVRPALLALLAAVGFVLLIACANVANLLLIRALARSKETAIRLALGASRGRIVRQMLTESLLISLAGSLTGLLLTFGGLKLLQTLRPANLPRLESVAIDAGVLAFSIAVCLLTALLSGLVPALRFSKPELQSSLKEGSKSVAPVVNRGLPGVLVVAEVALSVILLISAGLLIRTFVALHNVEPGFKPENVLTFQLHLPGARYGWGRTAEFFRQLEDRLGNLPGVEAVGTTSQLPFTGKGYGAGYSWDERSAQEGLTADWRFVTPNYLPTTGTRLLAGRFFTEQDDPHHPRAVIIDETLARKAWPTESAIGKKLLITDSTPRGSVEVWMEVVGVIEHVHNHELDAIGREQVYIPYAQTPIVPWMIVALRTSVAPAGFVKTIEQEVQALDKELPVNNVRWMESYVADAIAPTKFTLILMGIFAAVALILAAIGLYGVVSYSVNQRTQEVGIRLALGAPTSSVLKLIIGQGMRMVLVGLLIGVSGGFALTRLIASLLYAVSPTDPLTYVWVSSLLLGVALFACYIPARRATKVDPMIALKYE